MKKTLTQELDDELFQLNKRCWSGENRDEFIIEKFLIYMTRVEALKTHGYNVSQHMHIVKNVYGRWLFN